MRRIPLLLTNSAMRDRALLRVNMDFLAPLQSGIKWYNAIIVILTGKYWIGGSTYAYIA